MRRIVCLLLCLSLMFTASAAFAQSENESKEVEVLSSDGRTVVFTIEPSVKEDISQEEMISLADSNTDTSNIIIYNVAYAQLPEVEENTGTNNDASALELETIIGPIAKSYTAKNVLESDRWMDSCAKGETKTVSYTITESLAADISGDIYYGSFGIKDEVSYSITKGQTLVGPPESSSSNTREYRCKFYQNTGKWAQYVKIAGWPANLSGTFSEPTKAVSYSKDTYVN